MVVAWKRKVAVWCFLKCVCAVMWDLHVEFFICSHNQKSPVAPHFNHFGPRIAVVPLMMMMLAHVMSVPPPMVSYYPEKLCCMSFQMP